MNKLRTQTRIYKLKPTSYRRNLILSLDKMVEEAVEEDRVNYQENLMSTRNTHLIFKHFKSLKKIRNSPKDYDQGRNSCFQSQRKSELFE